MKKSAKHFLFGVLCMATVGMLGAAFAQPLAATVAVLFNGVKISVDSRQGILRDENGKKVKLFPSRESVFVSLRAGGEVLGNEGSWNMVLLKGKRIPLYGVNKEKNLIYWIEPKGEDIPEIKTVSCKLNEGGQMDIKDPVKELGTAELWDKLGAQLFWWKMDENNAGEFFLYRERKLELLPGRHDFDSGKLQFEVADLDQDGTFELYYVMFYGSGVDERNLYGYCPQKEIPCEFQLVNLPFTLRKEGENRLFLDFERFSKEVLRLEDRTVLADAKVKPFLHDKMIAQGGMCKQRPFKSTKAQQIESVRQVVECASKEVLPQYMDASVYRDEEQKLWMVSFSPGMNWTGGISVCLDDAGITQWVIVQD